MNVVVVESPAKAKTINKYLGKDYYVLASFGHVRDLPSKDGSVEPDQDFSMVWEVDSKAEKRLKDIADAIRKGSKLILATDPDREGEAISWHVREEMKRRRALGDKPVERVVFNEITKAAVTEAFQHPRDLDEHLVDAYLARRALDYLVGFTLSPVLWRKLPGSRSAGRVQSVALRLICEREAEIEVFKPQEYWTIEVALQTPEGASFRARLTALDGDRLDKFALGDEAAATRAATLLRTASAFTVGEVERKQVKRNPLPPFTTSTLQQEASRKLGFSASRTMRIAQKLYEGVDIGGETVGIITYMRTDGVQLAGEALGAARRLVAEEHGDRYLPPSPRQYKTKAKNAQEAHEAIRPTDLFRRPQAIRRRLTDDEHALYNLIWTRTLASQMASAEFEQVGVDIAVDGKAATLRATGQVLLFDGFLKLYQEGRDDAPAEGEGDDDRRLPKLTEGNALQREEVFPEQHFTQPPPRYSEASLIKRLEELGIGRPSTYTSILQVLQDRDYVRLEKRRFVPEDRGRIVTAFLESSSSATSSTTSPPRWRSSSTTSPVGGPSICGCSTTSGAPSRPPSTRPRACASARSSIRSTGSWDRTSSRPTRRIPTRTRASARSAAMAASGSGSARPAASSAARTIRSAASPGPWPCPAAPTARTAASSRPDRSSSARIRPAACRSPCARVPTAPICSSAKATATRSRSAPRCPAACRPPTSTLEQALALLALPRAVGHDPETSETIEAGIGRFGPYLRAGSVYR